MVTLWLRHANLMVLCENKWTWCEFEYILKKKYSGYSRLFVILIRRLSCIESTSVTYILNFIYFVEYLRGLCRKIAYRIINSENLWKLFFIQCWGLNKNKNTKNCWELRVFICLKIWKKMRNFWNKFKKVTFYTCRTLSIILG